jgi:hypothetical protein
MSITTLAKVNGQQAQLGTYGGAIKNDWRVNNAKVYLAAHFGVTVRKGDKMPDVKAAILASGVSSEDFKLARKEYDANKHAYHADCRKITALYASDPNYRQSIRKTATGAVTTFRKIASGTAKVSQAARIAQLEAKLAELGVVA